MNQELSSNYQMLNLVLASVPFNQNSLSMQLVAEPSRSFHQAQQEESFAFQLEVEKSKTLNTNLLDQNSIPFSHLFLSNTKRQENKEGSIFNDKCLYFQKETPQRLEEEPGFEGSFMFKSPEFRSGGKKEEGYKQEESEEMRGEEVQKREVGGLKDLSLEIKEILSVKKSASYKDLASILLSKHHQNRGQVHESSEQKARNNLNLRRRVYDALNVLVAVGILKRDNKKRLFINQSTRGFLPPNKMQTQRKQQLCLQLRQAQTQLLQKQKILELLSQKHQTLTKLCTRNREYPLNLSQSTLPFLLIQSQNLVNSDINLIGDSQIQISLQRQAKVTSDLNALAKYGDMVFGTK